MYISTPPSPEVENFQMKIYHPARDRSPDLLNQRQTCLPSEPARRAYTFSQNFKFLKRCNFLVNIISLLISWSFSQLCAATAHSSTLQFVKIATPRRKHVTEMKCIPQIRYMAIDKWLELQNCTWSVSMWFQYGVKPPCAAIRVSMRYGMESKRPWISSWGMSLHADCIRVHKASRVGAGGPWWISRRPTISQTC